MLSGVDLGDSVRVNLGTDNDLALFHTGGNGVIHNTTGELRIRANNLKLQDYTNEDLMIVATSDGSVDLYHNNAKKFETTSTGASVTGNLAVSGNLTVSGTTTELDTTNLNVTDKNITLNYHASNDTSSNADGAGITIQDAVNASTNATLTWNTSLDKFDLSHGLHIGSSSATGSATTPALQIGGTTTYRLGMYTDSETAYVENKNGDDGIVFRVKTTGEAMRIQSSGNVDIYQGKNLTWRYAAGSTIRGSISVSSADDMTFSTGSSNTERMRIATGGNVLIGTTSNNYTRGKFTVFGTPGNPATTGSNADNVAIRVATNTGNSQSFDIGMYNSGDYGAWLQASNSGSLNSHSPIVLNPNGGKVGIGTTSPGALLHLNGTGDAIRVESTNSGAGGAQIDLLHYTASPADGDINGVINFGGYYSGSSSAYAASIKSVWSDVSAKEGRLEFYTRDDSTFAHHMQINHHGGIAMGANNPGYDGQILSIKAGTGDNVLYGESTDANCIVSLRDNTSTANIGYGALGNAHIFSQDGTEVARISTGSADKYPTSGNGGIGGAGTNLHLAGDDSEIRMANQIIHSDNSGNTKFTIRNAYGHHSTLAELSLDSGYISFNTGSSYTERMRLNSNGTLMVGTQTNPTYTHKAVFSGNANIDGVVRIEDIDGSIALSNACLGLAFPNDNDATTGYFIYMTDGNGAIGSIQAASGTSVSFNTTSDERLKKNIVDASPQLDILKSVKVREFDWKRNDHHELGLIAQEIKDIIPNVVGEGGDDETKNPYGVDYGKLTPYLIKAVQELSAKNDALEARIATLEG